MFLSWETAFLSGRGYLPEHFRQIRTNLPELFHQIRMNLPELFRKFRSNLIFFYSNFKALIYIEEASCFRPFRTVWMSLFSYWCKIDYFVKWGSPHPLGPLKIPWKYIFLTLPLSTICNENIGQYLHLGLTPVVFLYPLSMGQQIYIVLLSKLLTQQP